MYTLKMDLRFLDTEAIIGAEITFPEQCGSFSFCLGENFVMDSIIAEGTPIAFCSEVIPNGIWDAWGNLICYTIEGNGFAKLKLHYHGKVQSLYSTIRPEVKVLSMTSFWFPIVDAPWFLSQLEHESFDPIIHIHGLEDHLVVKGEYFPDSRIWQYGGKGFSICNIIAFNQMLAFSHTAGKISVHVADCSEKETALSFLTRASDILRFYQEELYPESDLGHGEMDIVSTGTGEACAYVNMIHYKEMTNNWWGFSLLAHELAHMWCHGAKPLSWEIWLNETTAEWSGILYALRTNRHEYLESYKERHNRLGFKTPPIKNESGKQHHGHHHKGVLLFFALYDEYGEATIIELLRAFVYLKQKDTENYLVQVRTRLGAEIANRIEAELYREY